MLIRKLVVFALLVYASVTTLSATSWQRDSIDPRVFLIGENEAKMASLNKNFPTLLMTVCQNDMDIAYDKWMVMLSEMEVLSDKLNFDIKGLKMWMNVYWNKNGHIEYIGYYLKPNSRNVKIEDLNAFFNNFIKNYQMDLNAKTKFYHNGSASFPTHYKFLKEQEQKSSGGN